MKALTSCFRFLKVNPSRINLPIIKNIKHFTMKSDIKPQIRLNDAEHQIQKLLMEYCSHYNVSREKQERLVLRVTGGWVRDKLLGRESNDLDIAINHLSGQDFVIGLQKYLESTHPEQRLASFHLIKKNSEKSKHLETCTTKLFGLEVDFVNLRSEKYSSDSRVPDIEFGTAEEDAYRRDATLNSLFYNLNESKVEDFTGRGFEDLKNGILRSPLSALKTFLDDPLRVLRMIRFACKFDFTIERNTLEAMKNPEIKVALENKISKERVRVELEKILGSPNTEYGLNIVNHVGLTNAVFSLGSLHSHIMRMNEPLVIAQIDNISAFLPQRINQATASFPILKQCLSESPRSEIKSEYLKILDGSQSQVLLWLCIILQPFRLITIRVNPRKALPVNFVDFLLKNSLTFSKNEAEIVSNIVRASEVFHPQLEEILQNPDGISRSKFGFYLRMFGENSSLNLLLNCWNDCIKLLKWPSLVEQPGPLNHHCLSDTSQLSHVIEKYNNLFSKIIARDLRYVEKLKLMIDGKTLSSILNKKPGPWLGRINEEILGWQLDNPNATLVECEQYVKLLDTNL